MTKAEMEQEKAEARRHASEEAEVRAFEAAARARAWTGIFHVYWRERARLYRIALRAVREEVRRGK